MRDDRLVNAIIIAAIILGVIIISIALGGNCFGGACPGAKASMATIVDSTAPMSTISDTSHDSHPAKGSGTKPWTCKNKLARTLYEAGFTGHDHRQAWAIVMRESNGENLKPGHPAYNGADLGIWQINEPSWGGEPWFTYNAMTDPARQSRIVYRILTKKGTYWRPWGLTDDGQLDATQYGMWGPDLWDAWIMSPFLRYYAQYPCKTTPPKKETR